ncbi:MAG TPA: APC family permease [Candidatus Dormibacteraeota bacterium]|nr:APC family permease [Candidatus Dormibacteraeota bacterium]
MSTVSLPASLPVHTISLPKKRVAKLTLWPLVAATFFMVSGGTYGTEEIVHGAGYGRAILILLFTPILWSLPTAFMIGELSSALPAEGGYYAWVRRGLGNFWGFQEAWLSLVASIFDMAIYPTLFVAYLTRLAPWFGIGHRGVMVALGVVVVCAALNIAGIRVVGVTSLWLFFLLSAPFALIVVLAPFKMGALAGAHTAPVTSTVGLLGGTLIAMWNYMGWDNASTIAQEVERPQRTYPKAMIAAVILVSLTYILPVLAVYLTGVPAAAFETGSWADLAGMMGGNWLRVALVLGGMMSGFGMFNALVMSYSRLPLAMARDGMLPKIFAKTHPKTRAPWVAILVCATGWALCLGLGFERLVTLDVMLYGASLTLEFVTLVALRIREPKLKRGFRVPGGLPGAVLAGVFPIALLSISLFRSEKETVLGMNGLLFGFLIILSGFLVYMATGKLRENHAEHARLETAAAD